MAARNTRRCCGDFAAFHCRNYQEVLCSPPRPRKSPYYGFSPHGAGRLSVQSCRSCLRKARRSFGVPQSISLQTQNFSCAEFDVDEPKILFEVICILVLLFGK